MYDKTTEIKSKYKLLQSLKQNESEKCIQVKHTIEKPGLFDIDELFHKYINKHNKKIDLYPNTFHIKKVFKGAVYSHSKSKLRNIQSKLQ